MKKIILTIGIGVAILNSFAQKTESNSFSFSVQQAIDYAMQNEDNVKNAVLDEAIAKQKVNEIMGMGFPQINSSFDVKDYLEIPIIVFNGMPIKMGSIYQATAGLDASQLIFSGDYFLGLKASKVFVELSTKATTRTKIAIAATVSKAYYTVLVNDERMKLMDANVVRVKKVMDDTKAFFENGLAEKIDYDRLTVTYNNLLVEQEKIKKLLELGTYLLKYQMGMDITASLTLTDKLSDIKFDVGTNVSAEKFDYSKRVEYSLFQTQKTLAQLDLKRNRFSYLPTAFAYGSMSRNAQRDKFNFFDSNEKWYPTSLIGATIKMPIFTGLQRNAKNQQAKLALQKAENNIDFMKKSIDLELASSVTNLQNASSSLENQKKNMSVAEDVVRVAKIKLDQGVGSNLELITAETALKEAQTNYYNALFDALVSKIDFDKANGILK